MKRFLACVLLLVLLMVNCATAETISPANTSVTVKETEVSEQNDPEPEASVEPSTESTAEPTKEPGRLDGITIGIDPGHQVHENRGKEPVSPKGKEKKQKVSSGTSGKTTGIPEYKTVLEISLLLRDALIAEGANVVMTRETNDIDISNYERAMLMNRAKPDLVLRIHCDGSTKKATHGATMYVRKSIAYSKKEVPDPKALLKKEEDAAKCLIAGICKATGANNRGVCKRDTYTMNNWSLVPIVLVEMGFLSNPEEDEKLNDPGYQKLMAQGMVDGILDYFGR